VNSAARIALGVIFCVAVVGGVLDASRWWRTHVTPGPMPQVATLDLYARLVDQTPVTIAIGGDANAPWTTTVDQWQRTPGLWRRMDLANWNQVQEWLRIDVLERMLQRYRPVLMNPRAWDRMTPADWDEIPQPIRTVAYRQMIAYWAGYYDVGGGYGIPAGDIRDMLTAIAMSESWFDHRAVHVDVTGNRDIGLVQASDFARTRLRQLAMLGVVDVSFSDDEYWNPWKATRFLAVWMSLMLDESGGDLERATRAYNRGIAEADDAAGADYLAAVLRRRRRFIRNQDAPPAWSWLWHRAREIEAEEWPWLHGGSPFRQGPRS
jgi:hypothetical protein